MGEEERQGEGGVPKPPAEAVTEARFDSSYRPFRVLVVTGIEGACGVMDAIVERGCVEKVDKTFGRAPCVGLHS